MIYLPTHVLGNLLAVLVSTITTGFLRGTQSQDLTTGIDFFAGVVSRFTTGVAFLGSSISRFMIGMSQDLRGLLFRRKALFSSNLMCCLTCSSLTISRLASLTPMTAHGPRFTTPRCPTASRRHDPRRHDWFTTPRFTTPRRHDC